MKKVSKRWDKLAQELKKTPEYYAEKLAFKITLIINEELKKRNLKCNDLAKMLDVSKSYVSQIMDGKQNLTLLTLGKLAAALNLEVDIIFKNEIITDSPAIF